MQSYHHLGRQSGSILQAKHTLVLQYDPEIVFVDINPKEIKS